MSSMIRKITQKIAIVLLAGFFCLLGTVTPAAWAAPKVSPRVEEQILQVIRDHPEVILESLQTYQLKQQAQLQSTQQGFLEQLKTNPQTVIGNSATRGAEKPKLLIVEFSDFQCPYCAKAHETLKKLFAAHPEDLRLVYKHFPLNIHPEAIPAAKASWAALQQGKFWDYQDELFTQQEQLGESLYGEIAQKLNLDVEKFNQDRQSAAAEAAIQEDLALAERLGLTGTPFFVVSGRRFAGAVQWTDLEQALEAENAA